jgi:hypothetical protein
VGKDSLAHLGDHKLLVLPNVNMMDDDEADLIRKWVQDGGSLLATGWSSLVDTRGRLRKDFALGDVLGVTLERPSWSAWPHYIAPTSAADFGDFSATYPAFARTTGQGIAIRSGSSAEVLATTTLVWPAPDDSRFSSIHSNPPWQPTSHPEVVLNHFGKGKAIYCASPIETIEPLADTLVRLLRRLHADYSFEAVAPAAVELTLFRQPELHRYRLTLVNFQKDLPNVPVHQIPVRLRLPEKVHRIVTLPGNDVLPHAEHEGVVRFTVPKLETLAMIAITVG